MGKHSLIIGILFLIVCVGGVSFSSSYSGVLQDPVNLGGWLYQGKCTRCHGSAEDAELASNFDEESELIEAFTDGGSCSENWARVKSIRPRLKADELSALAVYLFVLEEQEHLELPDLPPQPKEKNVLVKVKTEKKMPHDPVISEGSQFPQYLTDVLDTNLIAKGGWLYVNNCYRCHLTYEEGRMGKGFERETIQLIITEGKTSTQMKPFSKVLGGNLKKKEINAIADYILKWEKDGEPPAISSELMTPPAFDPDQFKPKRLTRFRLVRGDKDSGKQFFKRNCVNCHGVAREGFIGPELRDFENLRPDLYVKSVLKKGVPGSLMNSWDKSKGGAFTAKSIDDVTVFLTVQKL